MAEKIQMLMNQYCAGYRLEWDLTDFGQMNHFDQALFQISCNVNILATKIAGERISDNHAESDNLKRNWLVSVFFGWFIDTKKYDGHYLFILNAMET